MGIETMIGIGVAGAVAGAIKGKKGTSGTVQNTGSTSTTNIAGAGKDELSMQQEALKNYFSQSGLANDYQGSLGSANNVQDAARNNAMGILDGSAYQLTPQEQQQIMGVRQQMVDSGMTDINKGLDQRYAQLNQSAGMRGLRGQAGAQLQGDSIRQGVEAQTGLQNNANLWAGQQALQLPYQRVASQQATQNQGMTMADMLRNQAQQNLQSASNPALMQMMQNERIAGASRSQTGSQTTPGQKGNWGDALLGGLGGFSTGAGTVANFSGALRGMDGPGFQGAGNASSNYLQPSAGPQGNRVAANPYDGYSNYGVPNFTGYNG